MVKRVRVKHVVMCGVNTWSNARGQTRGQMVILNTCKSQTRGKSNTWSQTRVQYKMLYESPFNDLYLYVNER